VGFSTESRVDPHHAHPFHTDAFPDIAVVHNGQITNYHNIRRRLERKGYKLKTENDTECIVFYIVDRLRSGESLRDALAASVDELDGPFSYILSTPKEIGIARDKLGLRPLMFASDRNGFYMASEECALLCVSSRSKPQVLKPGEVRVFERPGA
jgi:glutamine phosphoribosylpyrophosphate amidotransferase